ncbi:MAG TPA: DMT family transporter [Candidatus Acidoferrales bacterium]|nr:DMT family transporter [Candidatus Acidoferrales bacterium]
MTTRGWVLFAAMGVIWGIPYLFIKIAVGEFSPATVVFGRTAIGAALLLPIALLRSDLGSLRPHWRLLLVYTAVEIIGPWLLLSHAETRLSSSLSGLLIAGVPLVGALLALATGHDDRPDAARWLGLAIGFIGVGLVVGFNVATDDLVAVGEVGLVVVGYAIGAMLIARMRDVPSLASISASLAIAALVYLVPGLALWPATPPSAQALTAVAVLGVVCTALGFLGFFALIREVGANRATVIAYVNPAVAVALGVAVLGEPLTATIAAGFVLIALGSFVGTRRPPSTRLAAEASPDLGGRKPAV